MNEKVIPLSAPDGTVYAYACSVCRHIGSMGGFLAPHDDELVAKVAGFSKDDAERCCRCELCKVIAGPFSFGSPHVCAACLPAHDAEEAARATRCREAAERSAAVQAERLRASSDADAARALAELMSEISEDCWCAGWLSGTEFSLWGMLGDPAPVEWGMGEVNKVEIDRLRALSEKCGGWIRWEEDVGEVFVPRDEWVQMYDAHEERVPGSVYA